MKLGHHAPWSAKQNVLKFAFLYRYARRQSLGKYSVQSVTVDLTARFREYHAISFNLLPFYLGESFAWNIVQQFTTIHDILLRQG